MQMSDDKVTPAAGAWPPPLDSEPTAFYNITESRDGKGSTLFGKETRATAEPDQGQG